MHTFLAAAATSWGLVMGLAPLLQARVVIRRRSSAGVSTGWIGILLVGFIVWLCYGAVDDNWPLIISNSVALTVDAATLGVVLLYRPRPEIATITTEATSEQGR